MYPTMYLLETEPFPFSVEEIAGVIGLDAERIDYNTHLLMLGTITLAGLDFEGANHCCLRRTTWLIERASGDHRAFRTRIERVGRFEHIAAGRWNAQAQLWQHQVTFGRPRAALLKEAGVYIARAMMRMPEVFALLAAQKHEVAA